MPKHRKSLPNGRQQGAAFGAAPKGAVPRAARNGFYGTDYFFGTERNGLFLRTERNEFYGTDCFWERNGRVHPCNKKSIRYTIGVRCFPSVHAPYVQ